MLPSFGPNHKRPPIATEIEVLGALQVFFILVRVPRGEFGRSDPRLFPRSSRLRLALSRSISVLLSVWKEATAKARSRGLLRHLDQWLDDLLGAAGPPR